MLASSGPAPRCNEPGARFILQSYQKALWGWRSRCLTWLWTGGPQLLGRGIPAQAPRASSQPDSGPLVAYVLQGVQGGG